MSASKVLPNLWVGSKPPDGHTVGKCVKVVVLCAEEVQPPSRWFKDVRVIRCPLPDAKLSLEEVDRADKVGRVVASLVRKRIPVLVTCNMGLNRSGLVTCIAMCDLGMRPSQAISRVREARGRGAMSNPWFERYLNSIVLHHAMGPEEIRQVGEPAYLD